MPEKEAGAGDKAKDDANDEETGKSEEGELKDTEEVDCCSSASGVCFECVFVDVSVGVLVL